MIWRWRSDFEHGRGVLATWDPPAAYYDKIASLVSLARPMKVVVDTGNGVAGLFVPEMLRRLGCEVVELYTDPDPTFPNHLPDPEKEENMLDLMALVPKVGAEVGLAWDGDGDRLGVCDERGHRWEADFANILLARDLLTRHPGATILLDVKSSINTLEDLKAHGGNPQLGKTGHSFMKRRMKADGILLGGELLGPHVRRRGLLADRRRADRGRPRPEHPLALGQAALQAVRRFAAAVRDTPDPVALPRRSEV